MNNGKTRKSSGMEVYMRISPNSTKPRNKKIRRLTPHCVAGNLKIETTLGLSSFINYDTNKGASTNYTIGTDGRIGLGVEETNRAWTTSCRENDMEAITFEISNNGGAPDWPMSDMAIESWLRLAENIVRFYGFKRVAYKAKPSSVARGVETTEKWIKTWDVDPDAMIITFHTWYVNKSCPGNFLMKKMPSLVDELNKRLGNYAQEEKPIPVEKPSTNNKVPYLIKINTPALNVRKGPGIKYGTNLTLTNDPNTYTIVEESEGNISSTEVGKWGRLKSGAGWIALKYTKKV